ncbi:hypothetical protein N1851_004480 [Merluccius polli]|uniref:Uncharacterized protein n=1 Tax=Merluccius polli TaxID=89951 RepID=A0AA47N898_MERPO|nr:hypothetical protein N1851_004480 [Merluccius polli]
MSMLRPGFPAAGAAPGAPRLSCLELCGYGCVEWYCTMACNMRLPLGIIKFLRKKIAQHSLVLDNVLQQSQRRSIHNSNLLTPAGIPVDPVADLGVLRRRDPHRHVKVPLLAALHLHPPVAREHADHLPLPPPLPLPARPSGARLLPGADVHAGARRPLLGVAVLVHQVVRLLGHGAEAVDDALVAVRRRSPGVVAREVDPLQGLVGGGHAQRHGLLFDRPLQLQERVVVVGGHRPVVVVVVVRGVRQDPAVGDVRPSDSGPAERGALGRVDAARRAARHSGLRSSLVRSRGLDPLSSPSLPQAPPSPASPPDGFRRVDAVVLLALFLLLQIRGVSFLLGRLRLALASPPAAATSPPSYPPPPPASSSSSSSSSSLGLQLEHPHLELGDPLQVVPAVVDAAGGGEHVSGGDQHAGATRGQTHRRRERVAGGEVRVGDDEAPVRAEDLPFPASGRRFPPRRGAAEAPQGDPGPGARAVLVHRLVSQNPLLLRPVQGRQGALALDAAQRPRAERRVHFLTAVTPEGRRG